MLSLRREAVTPREFWAQPRLFLPVDGIISELPDENGLGLIATHCFLASDIQDECRGVLGCLFDGKII